MKLERVQRKIRMTPFDLVRYQVVTEVVFFRKEHLILSDIDLLSLLALWGPVELRAFCARAARNMYPEVKIQHMPTREQNVRNRLVKLAKRGLLIKNPDRTIVVNPTLGVTAPGRQSVLLDHQLVALQERAQEALEPEREQNHTPEA
jgi:hypothetical protein